MSIISFIKEAGEKLFGQRGSTPAAAVLSASSDLACSAAGSAAGAAGALSR